MYFYNALGKLQSVACKLQRVLLYNCKKNFNEMMLLSTVLSKATKFRGATLKFNFKKRGSIHARSSLLV